MTPASPHHCGALSDRFLDQTSPEGKKYLKLTSAAEPWEGSHYEQVMFCPWCGKALTTKE